MPQNLPIILFCTTPWVTLLFPQESPNIIILNILGPHPLFGESDTQFCINNVTCNSFLVIWQPHDFVSLGQFLDSKYFTWLFLNWCSVLKMPNYYDSILSSSLCLAYMQDAIFCMCMDAKYVACLFYTLLVTNWHTKCVYCILFFVKTLWEKV